MARIVRQKLCPFRRRFAELAGLIGNPNKDRRAQVIGELSISRWHEVLCGCGRVRGWCALCRCDRENRSLILSSNENLATAVDCCRFRRFLQSRLLHRSPFCGCYTFPHPERAQKRVGIFISNSALQRGGCSFLAPLPLCECQYARHRVSA